MPGPTLVNGRWRNIAALTACLLLAPPLAAAALTKIGGYDSGLGAGAAEIVAYCPVTQRLAVLNAEANCVDLVQLAADGTTERLQRIECRAYGRGVTSLAMLRQDAAPCLVAVAVEGPDRLAAGSAQLFDQSGRHLTGYPVGIGPDMIAASADGRWLLVANEGQPSRDYRIDPEGSITAIDCAAGPAAGRVHQLDFRAWNGQEAALRAAGIRIFGGRDVDGDGLVDEPSGVAEDLEPEYIAIDAAGKRAWVTLQENNAIAILSLDPPRVVDLVGLGGKDLTTAAYDFSDRDGGSILRCLATDLTFTGPVIGLQQPDGIACFRHGEEDLLLIANEGDARDYPGFSEEVRVADLTLDPLVFQDADRWQKKDRLGRLVVSRATGDVNGDGKHDRLEAFGGRSFAVLDSAGTILFDSGNAITRLVWPYGAEPLNADTDKGDTLDSRSDAKGAEPESVVAGLVHGHPYAFVGLERANAIAVFDLSDPRQPRPLPLHPTSDGQGGGDLSPEGLCFVPAEDSPTGDALLLVACERSGTVAIIAVR